MKKIGLIGGAGPEAGALLLKNIIQACQQNGAWEDHDFPSIMLLSRKFSPMINSDNHKKDIISEIQAAVNTLDANENEVVGIACNTLHSFVQHVNFKSMVFVSIVDEVINVIKKEQNYKILFLGTKTSVNAKIYETSSSVQNFYPTIKQQELIQECIIRILKNQHSSLDSLLVSTIINDCHETIDFNAVILGCTELSVIHQNNAIESIKHSIIYDPITILAHKLISL